MRSIHSMFALLSIWRRLKRADKWIKSAFFFAYEDSDDIAACNFSRRIRAIAFLTFSAYYIVREFASKFCRSNVLGNSPVDPRRLESANLTLRG